MSTQPIPEFYLIDSRVVPDIFVRVIRAKELLKTGQAATVSAAVAEVGISRSAFYKYKDSVSPFVDMQKGRMVTLQLKLHDYPGILSKILSALAESNSNILTINQSIPINATASVTVTIDTTGMSCSVEELIALIQKIRGMIDIEILAG